MNNITDSLNVRKVCFVLACAAIGITGCSSHSSPAAKPKSVTPTSIVAVSASKPGTQTATTFGQVSLVNNFNVSVTAPSKPWKAPKPPKGIISSTVLIANNSMKPFDTRTVVFVAHVNTGGVLTHVDGGGALDPIVQPGKSVAYETYFENVPDTHVTSITVVLGTLGHVTFTK